MPIPRPSQQAYADWEDEQQRQQADAASYDAPTSLPPSPPPAMPESVRSEPGVYPESAPTMGEPLTVPVPAPAAPMVPSGIPTTVDLAGGAAVQGTAPASQRDYLLSYGAQSALRAGLGEDGARAIQAILVTEGGMTGAIGDRHLNPVGSHGPFQFYGSNVPGQGGQLNTFAAQNGMTLQQAGEYVRANPEAAIDWAINGYLGNAVRRGQQAGLSGSALATYGQRYGQVSESPERAGGNYNALFGPGGAPPAAVPTTQRPSGMGQVPTGVPASAAPSPSAYPTVPAADLTPYTPSPMQAQLSASVAPYRERLTEWSGRTGGYQAPEPFTPPVSTEALQGMRMGPPLTVPAPAPISAPTQPIAPDPAPSPAPTSTAPALGATAYGLQDDPTLGQSSYDTPSPDPALGAASYDLPTSLGPPPAPTRVAGWYGENPNPPAPQGVETIYDPSGQPVMTSTPPRMGPPLDLSGITKSDGPLPEPQATSTVTWSPTPDPVIPPQVREGLDTLGRAGFGPSGKTAEQEAEEWRSWYASQGQYLSPAEVALGVAAAPAFGSGSTGQDIPHEMTSSAYRAAEEVPEVREWNDSNVGPFGIKPLDVVQGVADLAMPLPAEVYGSAGRVAGQVGKGIEGVAGRAAREIGQAGEERAIGGLARDLRPQAGFHSNPIGVGVGATPEPAPRGRVPVPPPSQGDLLPGIGRMNLPEDMQRNITQTWERAGQKPETISWDETLNDLARQVKADPVELARRWADAPRGEATAELAKAKAYMATLEQEQARLTTRVQQGTATAEDLARLDDAKIQSTIMMLGVRREAGEHGRALNYLRMGTQIEQAKLADFQYSQVARVANEAKRGLARVAKNGQLDEQTAAKLKALQGALEREAKGEGPTPVTGALDDLLRQPKLRPGTPNVGGTEGTASAARAARPVKPMSPALEQAVVKQEPGLGEQLVRLNREQNAARDAGNLARVAELEPQRQSLLQQITDKIRQQEEAKITAAKPQLTAEQVQAEADKAMARGIVARLRQQIHEEMNPEAVAGRAAQGLDRKFDQAIARDTVAQIDRLMKAAPDSRTVRTLANDMLQNLEATSGYAEQIARQYRERVTRAQLQRVFPGNPAAITPQMLEDFARLDWTDPRAVAQASRILAAKPSLVSQLGAVRIASLLSGTGTQIVNTLGNSLMTAYAPISRAAAAGGEQLVTRGGRSRRPEAQLSNVAAELSGMVGSFRAAVDDAQRTFTTGISSNTYRDLSTQTGEPIRIPVLSPLNYVFRMMGATDDFFRTMNRGGAIMAEADRIAQREGRTLDQVLLNIADYPDVIERGATEAKRRTLQADPSNLMRAVGLARQNPAIHFLIPFFNTNANALRVGSDLSPLGFNRARRAASNPDLIASGSNLAAAADARGDAIFGTSLMTATAILASAGLVTGYGSTDERTRNAQMEAGWRPWSAKVGDKYVPYQNLLGPFAVPVALAATLVEAMQNGMSQQKAEAALGTFVRNAGQYTLDASGLKGISDFLKGVLSQREGDMGRAAEQYVEGAATSIVPFGGALGTLARMTDPTVRNPDSVIEAILSRLPGLSRTVPSSLDRWGEEKTRTMQGPLALLPTGGVSQESGDLVRQEVLRLQQRGFKVAPEFLDKTMDLNKESVRLSRDQWRKGQTAAGQMAHGQLTALMAHPDWGTLPDGTKAQIIKKAVEQSREYARYLLKPEIQPVAYQQYLDKFNQQKAAGQ